jgi:predicted nucleic acid-binding protein
MHGIVIDTSVFIAALRSSRGASYRPLEMAGDLRWQMHLSVALALEYEAVGKREAAKLGIPDFAVDDIVDMLCQTSQHHAIHFRLRPELADPDDEFVLDSHS